MYNDVKYKAINQLLGKAEIMWVKAIDKLLKDENSNVIFGNVLAKDIEGCLVIGNKRLIATVDLKDLIIVETDDAVLIAKRGSAQKVKHVVEELKRERQIEVFEHRTAYRPWGECTILEDHPGYKIKRIVIKPGASIDLHIHHHCSKHWIVVKGTAKGKPTYQSPTTQIFSLPAFNPSRRIFISKSPSILERSSQS